MIHGQTLLLKSLSMEIHNHLMLFLVRGAEERKKPCNQTTIHFLLNTACGVRRRKPTSTNTARTFHRPWVLWISLYLREKCPKHSCIASSSSPIHTAYHRWWCLYTLCSNRARHPVRPPLEYSTSRGYWILPFLAVAQSARISARVPL